MKNDVGQTPLDIALSRLFVRGIDVAFYLVNRGCGRKEDKGKLLCAACQYGRLDIVKELVEQHKLDIHGEQRCIKFVYNFPMCLGIDNVEDIS